MTKAALFVPTALTLVTIWCMSVALAPGSAFIPNYSQHGHQLSSEPAMNSVAKTASYISRPATVLREAMGAQGVFAYGLGFGLLAAFATRSATRTTRRAEGEETGIAVKEKTEAGGIVPYLENVPRALYEKRTVNAILNLHPKEEWEDPPEDSPLWILKQYAETYGEGKSTKMSWWDYFYLKTNQFDPVTLEESSQSMFEKGEAEMAKYAKDGTVATYFPTTSGYVWLAGGMQTKWRGREYFAGDQTQTWMTSSGFARQYIGNWAFYRQGLQPWQRGLEIGLAHGYFLIGPFAKLGPLRDTPEGATVALLCAAAVVGIVSVGGLLFGTVEKPTLFDREGEPKGSGFQEVINWHAVGGLGGVGAAHALLTVFSG